MKTQEIIGSARKPKRLLLHLAYCSPGSFYANHYLIRWAMMHVYEMVINIVFMECSNLSGWDSFYRTYVAWHTKKSWASVSIQWHCSSDFRHCTKVLFVVQNTPTVFLSFYYIECELFAVLYLWRFCSTTEWVSAVLLSFMCCEKTLCKYFAVLSRSLDSFKAFLISTSIIYFACKSI